MRFRLDTPYVQIPSLQTEATFGAMMEMLLKTRLKLHLETNEGGFPDEDVNAYLAGLLVSYIDPGYLQGISPSLFRYEIDLYHSVTHAEDRVQAYWIYKINADDLLITLGLFRRLWKESRQEVDRLKRYYLTASDYQRRIYGKRTAVAEIQAKLADTTGRYLSILEGIRMDYLHLIEPVQADQLAGFRKELADLELELPLKSLLDQFLDGYALWLKGSREPSIRQRLFELTEEIQKLEPGIRLPSAS
ncbi:MAG: hypothetical protein HYZ90_02490 [Candidatus Omnitrophica bacterium]|nr:hypothetical protein [Candidatus Omnitrophota bacterium]